MSMLLLNRSNILLQNDYTVPYPTFKNLCKVNKQAKVLIAWVSRHPEWKKFGGAETSLEM